MVSSVCIYSNAIVVPSCIWNFDECRWDEGDKDKYTRKLLGLPLGLSDVAKYCRQAKMKLHLKSIMEEFKSG